MTGAFVARWSLSRDQRRKPVTRGVSQLLTYPDYASAGSSQKLIQFTVGYENGDSAPSRFSSVPSCDGAPKYLVAYSTMTAMLLDIFSKKLRSRPLKESAWARYRLITPSSRPALNKGLCTAQSRGIFQITGLDRGITVHDGLAVCCDPT
jgi:hypothetical protein